MERSRYNVYPSCGDVCRALLLTSYADTKVVILGQDPYHGAGQAHGLSFSVPCGIPVPPSLKNIHLELNEEVDAQPPNHGNLESWARRGVLLLNTTLTVREGAPGSHRGKGWETFTDQVIWAVDQKPDRVVFMLWGKNAQSKCGLIDTSRHVVICSSHPSPIAASKPPKPPKPFRGSKPFTRANEALVAAGLAEIDWTLNDCPESDT